MYLFTEKDLKKATASPEMIAVATKGKPFSYEEKSGVVSGFKHCGKIYVTDVKTHNQGSPAD